MRTLVRTLTAFGTAAALFVPVAAHATTITGHVTALSPTSVTVLDREAVTVRVDRSTVFTALLTEKPWQGSTTLTANAIHVGSLVVVHVPDGNGFVANWIQVAVNHGAAPAAATSDAASHAGHQSDAAKPADTKACCCEHHADDLEHAAR